MLTAGQVVTACAVGSAVALVTYVVVQVARVWVLDQFDRLAMAVDDALLGDLPDYLLDDED